MPRIARFTFVVGDESSVIRDRTEGCRCWALAGTSVLSLHWKPWYRYCARFTYCRQFQDVRSPQRSGDTVEYLKSLYRYFGNTAVMADRASPHCTKLVKTLLRENREIRIIYLPKESPHLNAVEKCWRRAKQASCLKTLQEKAWLVARHIWMSQNDSALPGHQEVSCQKIRTRPDELLIVAADSYTAFYLLVRSGKMESNLRASRQI